MNKELFFDIVSDDWAAGLYRLVNEDGKVNFYYHHTLADLEDEDKNTAAVSETYFPDFISFWKHFTTNNRWFTFHPLYIHREQRQFIKDALRKVNWDMVADEKWRQMYERQWNKVLNGPLTYYSPLRP